MTEAAMRDKVLRVLRVWEEWSLFPPLFLTGLEATFFAPAETDVEAFVAAAGLAEVVEGELDEAELKRKCHMAGITSNGTNRQKLARLQNVGKYASERAKKQGQGGGEGGDSLLAVTAIDTDVAVGGVFGLDEGEAKAVAAAAATAATAAAGAVAVGGGGSGSGSGGGRGTAPATSSWKVVDDGDDDVDGEPLDGDDEDDVDGVPMGDDDELGGEDVDVDGEPLDEEGDDVDGVPMDEEVQAPVTVVAAAVPASRWDDDDDDDDDGKVSAPRAKRNRH
jgi:hypothetical protein